MGGRAIVAELAAEQWGLVAAAQLEARGGNRMLLSRMASAGELERLMHGIYVTTAQAGERWQELRAQWIALEPGTEAGDRLEAPYETGVVSHTSAALLHGIGDFTSDVFEFTLPFRRRSRREGARFHRGELSADEVTIIDGLPVTTPERTIADLLTDGHDLSHVAEAVGDIVSRNLATTKNLIRALDRVAERMDAESGAFLLEELLAVVGMDPVTVTGQLMRNDAVREAVASLARSLQPRWIEQLTTGMLPQIRYQTGSVTAGLSRVSAPGFPVGSPDENNYSCPREDHGQCPQAGHPRCGHPPRR